MAMSGDDVYTLGGFHAEGRVLYTLTSGDRRPWCAGFQIRFEDWLRTNPRDARRALRKRQRQAKLRRHERRLIANLELARELVKWWRSDFALRDPTEAEFLADAILAAARAKNPARPTCDYCGEARKLHDVRPDAYSTSVRRVCEACFVNAGRARLASVSPAVALFAEVSAIEGAQLVATLESVESGLYESSGSARRRPLTDLSSTPINNDGRLDGFHIEKIASNGVAQGAPKRGATNVPYVLAKIKAAYPIEKFRAVASLRGPAVNGDGPIRDELDRVTFEYYKVHGGNVAAFALFFGIERKHVYARAERHRKRSQTQAA